MAGNRINKPCRQRLNVEFIEIKDREEGREKEREKERDRGKRKRVEGEMEGGKGLYASSEEQLGRERGFF